MELSLLYGCDIAMFLFGPDDKLAQYTSSEMEGLLDRYSRTCQQPHETRNNQDVRLALHRYAAIPISQRLALSSPLGLCFAVDEDASTRVGSRSLGLASSAEEKGTACIFVHLLMLEALVW